ncbi:hypothetical protein ACQ3I4_11735 [Zafaria sp. Z1313]|uniref:hypothetical protein n=1 Tax=unclassified Zafaria TaxID=2828765 RepID=UPI002E77F5CF|nr:hypothetical protein [Zafaria sp. J156]MEE1622052.1 hypothetical protein [Zafaria sp. J156]
METTLWVLVPLLLVGGAWWWISSLRKKNSAEVAGSIGPDAARDAASRLNADQHRAVYQAIARGDFMGAVRGYREATGQGVKQCIVAVRSLEAHPQVHGQAGGGAGPRGADTAGTADRLDPASDAAGSGDAARAVEPPADGPGTSGGTEEDSAENREGGTSGETGAPSDVDETVPAPARNVRRSTGDFDGDFVVPEEWSEKFGSGAGRTTSVFKITAERNGESHEFSSNELPPAEGDQFQSLLRDHDFAGAAALFAAHSGLDAAAIQRLLESAPVDGPASAAGRHVSDFSFEGDGPSGPVRFSAADLPPADRELFLEHVSAGRMNDAAEIVHRNTGLPVAVVLQLLDAFNG